VGLEFPFSKFAFGYQKRSSLITNGTSHGFALSFAFLSAASHLNRLETEVQKRTDPGYGPVFTLIDNPRDPENAQRLEDAERFRRDNPIGLIIRHLIVHPPNGELNWENVSREERER
jgi:hypothetical protein